MEAWRDGEGEGVRDDLNKAGRGGSCRTLEGRVDWLAAFGFLGKGAGDGRAASGAGWTIQYSDAVLAAQLALRFVKARGWEPDGDVSGEYTHGEVEACGGRCF